MWTPWCGEKESEDNFSRLCAFSIRGIVRGASVMKALTFHASSEKGKPITPAGALMDYIPFPLHIYISSRSHRRRLKKNHPFELIRGVIEILQSMAKFKYGVARIIFML